MRCRLTSPERAAIPRCAALRKACPIKTWRTSPPIIPANASKGATMKTALLVALTIFASQFAYAGGDAAAGAQKAKPCAACHGADFNTPISADIPRLAGQYA